MKGIVFLIILAAALSVQAFGQDPPKELTMQEIYQVETAFEKGNDLMEARKYAEALEQYEIALKIVPEEAAILFNAGMAAFATKKYESAETHWSVLKKIDPSDWHVRAKLIQTYQALGELEERDKERTELFEMKRTGKNAELNEQIEYCRDQFEAGGKKVMAFELFELKGSRALRYVFSIMNEAGDGEEFRISLGSYDLTNSVWRATTKPTPKEDERLFHLDGYFPSSHATYGMFFPEPSYDDVRTMVINILEKKEGPVSGTVYNPGAGEKDAEKKPEKKPGDNR
ncbi:MAG: tetratricopeptide repeat protein [Acidobacteriota bacterium]|nr:MAG: tetratricopeptide repeat protein [Acidobacteriota bacterium]